MEIEGDTPESIMVNRSGRPCSAVLQQAGSCTVAAAVIIALDNENKVHGSDLS
jgi:hypothetical protein